MITFFRGTRLLRFRCRGQNQIEITVRGEGKKLVARQKAPWLACKADLTKVLQT
jgi:hypothetical protein